MNNKRKNTNLLKSKKLILISLLITVLGMLLCGFLSNKPEIVLDTKKNIIYQNYSIDKILADFAADDNLAENTYKKAQIVLLGKVSEISKDCKDVTLISISGNQEGTIKCSSSDKNIISFVGEELSKDNIVKVYGEFSVGFRGGLSMSTSKIEKSEGNSISNTNYSLLDGYTIDMKNMYTRTLAKDKITYYIPVEWSNVEYNLVENNLGNIEGYQYRLNEIANSEDIYPESFFVCYFDNKSLKNSSDKSKTEKIERTIIANILDKKVSDLGKVPTDKATTYYGVKYQYYQDAYQDTLANKGYHVEFAFQKVNTDGIIVYLYIYRDSNHLNDIMYLMRLLNVK